MVFLHFSFASYNAWFNATLIFSSENLEVTLRWKKREVKLAFSRFFFSESEGKREASEEPQTGATGEGAEKISACLALLARFALAFAAIQKTQCLLCTLR